MQGDAFYIVVSLFLTLNIYIACTLSLQGRRSEGIKYASCCVAFAPCTPGTCRFCALHGTNFMPFDSGELKRREFLHFQGRRRRRTGSTLIEDNAENEEIITLRRAVPCKLRVIIFQALFPFNFHLFFRLFAPRPSYTRFFHEFLGRQRAVPVIAP